MGQKVNSIIFRSGLKNSQWNFKYIEKNKEESSIFLYKNIEIQKYVDEIFKRFNIFIKNCDIEYTDSNVNIIISFYEFKYKNNNLYLNNSLIQKNKSFSGLNPKNNKQLISYIITKILTLSTNLYLKNKTTTIKTQNLTKKFEIYINSNLKFLNDYKKTLKSFKRFLKDPLQKNIIQILFIVISEKNSSKLLANAISLYLAKHKKKHNFLVFLLKTVINNLIPLTFSKTKGIKIALTGRFNGAPRAKKKVLTMGVVPLQSFDEKISYYNSTSFTQNGTFGVKVWICEKY